MVVCCILMEWFNGKRKVKNVKERVENCGS